jgi:hypothetical protein
VLFVPVNPAADPDGRRVAAVIERIRALRRGLSPNTRGLVGSG